MRTERIKPDATLPVSNENPEPRAAAGTLDWFSRIFRTRGGGHFRPAFLQHSRRRSRKVAQDILRAVGPRSNFFHRWRERRAHPGSAGRVHRAGGARSPGEWYPVDGDG